LATRLRRDEVHSEYLAGDIGGFIGGAGKLDAAGFAAAAGVDLRLDDDNVGL
jgi:hypothetical protein